MKKVTLLIIVLLLQSCSSTSSSNKFVSSPHYKKRSVVREDYLKIEGQSFSSKEINNLLSQKINLNKPLKLAVVRIGHDHQSYQYTWDKTRINLKNEITSNKQDSYSKIIHNSKNIKDVSVIPSFMLPVEKSFTKLRDIAALMQANLLLVIKGRSHTDYDYNILKNNEAKANVTLEAVVLDVRTGIIPFTSVSSTSHQSKKKGEFSNEEFQKTTTLIAEDKAIREIFDAIANYF